MRGPAIALSALAAVCALARPDHAAAQALEFLRGADCQADGTVDPDTVMTSLLKAGGASMSLELARAWDGKHLGTRVVTDAALANVKFLALDMLTTGLDQVGPDGMRVVRVGSAGPTGLGAVQRYLNREPSLFVVRCTPEQAVQGRREDTARDEGPALTWIVGAGSDDAAAAELADREFAKISYTQDWEADEEVIAVDLYVGALINGVPVRPYLAYQRKTTSANPLNDLTFGLQYERLGPFGLISGGISYETDDSFDSALYRADLTWDTGLNLSCRRIAGLTCHPYVYADFISVEDAGDKASLLDQSEYLRLGAGLEVNYWWLTGSGGAFDSSLSYRMMHTIDGDDGDAAEFRAGVDWLPVVDGHFALGLEYVDGEDPTSLTPQENLMLYLGFRY